MNQEEENEILKYCSTGGCYYGSSFRSYKSVYREDINQKDITWPATAKDVLNIIGIENIWDSEHIRDLNQTYIPYPGYNPCTINDEIHNDYHKNYIFKRPDEIDDEEPDYYESLKKIVKDGIIWFVLFYPNGKDYVSLYAVGFSKISNSLIGVETSQTCHNLCD